MLFKLPTQNQDIIYNTQTFFLSNLLNTLFIALQKAAGALARPQLRSKKDCYWPGLFLNWHLIVLPLKIQFAKPFHSTQTLNTRIHQTHKNPVFHRPCIHPFIILYTILIYHQAPRGTNELCISRAPIFLNHTNTQQITTQPLFFPLKIETRV